MKRFLVTIFMINLLVITMIIPTRAEVDPVDAIIVNDVLEEIRLKYPRWEDMYEPYFFDCSEMTAYVSYRLNEAGIPNRVMRGNVKAIYGSAHAWICTENNLIVEATRLIIPDPNYYDYASLYSDIREADLYGSEWDWWNSITNQQRYLHNLTIIGNAGERKWAIAQIVKDFRWYYTDPY